MDESVTSGAHGEKETGPLEWRCEACGFVQRFRDGCCVACGAMHPDLEKPVVAGPSLLGMELDAPALSRKERVNLLIEVSVVLLVTWGGVWFAGLSEIIWPDRARAGQIFWYRYLWRAFGAIQDIALVLFIIRRNAEPWETVGLARFRPLKDTVGAAIVYAIEHGAHLGYAFLLGHLIAHLFPPPAHSAIRRLLVNPDSGVEWSAAVPLFLLMAFSEELVMRGYLIPRLERILGSAGEAILLSAALFGLGHAYQGFHGVVGAAFFGLVYGTIFAVTQRLWPLVFAHAALNFWLAATR